MVETLEGDKKIVLKLNLVYVLVHQTYSAIINIGVEVNVVEGVEKLQQVDQKKVDLVQL